MLNVFRDNLRHLKWVLILVIVGLVLYLGFYFRSDKSAAGGGDWVARVDGEVIGGEQYREAARRMDEYYRQMLGERYEQFRDQLNIGAMTANALVDQRIQMLEARKLGLEASPAEVARTIQNDPRFKDASGQFIGRDRYSEVIARNWPGGVGDFEQRLRDEITNRKWTNLASEAVGVTDREIEERYRSRADRTRVNYAMVPASEQKYDTKATSNELAAYYTAHAADYRRGEARKIRFVVLDRMAYSEKIEVTDADVKAHYDAHQDQFARKDQRRARHILFRLQQGGSEQDKAAARKKAEDALAQVKGGADFAALAQQLSQDVGSAQQGGDLGYFERGRMVPAFDQAAFETAVGEFAPVVETPFGFHVLQVTDARAAGVQPLDEVKDNLKKQLRLTRAQDQIQAEADRIRAEITNANDFETVAAKEGLTVQEKIVARDERLQDLQPSPQFMEAVFATEVASVTSPQAVSKGLAIVAIKEDVPPSTRPMEEVIDRVRGDLLNARGREAARTAAANAFAKNKTLEDAAKALGVQVRPTAEASPGQGLAGTGGISPELEAALFGPLASNGASGVVPVPAGAAIYRIVQVNRFDPAQLAARKEEIRKEILNQRKSEFVQGVTDRLRQNHEIEMNYQLLGTAKP